MEPNFFLYLSNRHADGQTRSAYNIFNLIFQQKNSIIQFSAISPSLPINYEMSPGSHGNSNEVFNQRFADLNERNQKLCDDGMLRFSFPKRFFLVAGSALSELFAVAFFCFLTAVLVVDFAVWQFDHELPDHDKLSNYEPPTISRIFSAKGTLLDEFANQRRLFSPIEEIPSLVQNAFISAEDKNFYAHAGYDPIGIVKAVLQALSGERLRGASTITQQVMKNFLLGNDRSVERKVKEILLASRLEQTFSKDQILELYLNEIFLGQNSYGVTAAAQTYFNKPLEELSIEEAAYLAALPKAPSRYHPVRQRDGALQRRNFVIDEMVENGYIDAEAGREAKKTELKTVMNGDYESFRKRLPPRSYFTDEIRRELSESFGEEEFFTGGLTIRATIDEELQAIAASVLRAGLESYDRKRSGLWRGTGLAISSEQLNDDELWQATLASLDLARDIPGWKRAVVLSFQADGATIGIEEGQSVNSYGTIPNSDVVWAKKSKGGNKAQKVSDILNVGDVVFVAREDSGENLWTLKQVPEIQGAFIALDVNSGRVLAIHGGFSYGDSVFNRVSQANRQPGSAFKPFVYAAALDSGYTPATIVIDAPIEMETPEGIWRPKNSGNKFFGPVTLRTGIELSRNLMTIRLARDVGLETVADYAETFGLYDHMDPFLANSLGAQETTLFQIVAAYAMFANGGERVQPTLVDRVQNRRGKTIYKHDERFCLDCKEPNLIEGMVPQIFNYRTQVIDPITAYQMTAMMQGVVERGTARHTVQPGVPVAGKTGTTNDSRDAWFIGFTPDIVAGCHMGFDIPKSLGKHAYGSNLCGPVFNEFIMEAVKKYGSSDFEPPEGGIFVAIDGSTGELVSDIATESSNHVVNEFFRLGSQPVAGIARIIDGGFPMSSDLGIYDPEAEEDLAGSVEQENQQSTTDNQQSSRGSFGSLSSGGLY